MGGFDGCFWQLCEFVGPSPLVGIKGRLPPAPSLADNHAPKAALATLDTLHRV